MSQSVRKSASAPNDGVVCRRLWKVVMLGHDDDMKDGIRGRFGFRIIVSDLHFVFHGSDARLASLLLY